MLNRICFGVLFLVFAPRQHPIATFLQQLSKIFDALKIIRQYRCSDGADRNIDAVLLLQVDLISCRTKRRFKLQRFFLRSNFLTVVRHQTLSSAAFFRSAANWLNESSNGGTILAKSGKIGPPIVSDIEN